MITNHTGYPLVHVDELKPNPRNSRGHPEDQIKLLAKIIQYQGWRYPVIVSKRSGFMVSGHGRRMAALYLNQLHVPVSHQDFDSEEQELAHLIADNRIPELSTTNTATLKEVLIEMDSGAFDMDLTGFVVEDLEKLMAPLDMPKADVMNGPNEEGEVCQKCLRRVRVID